MILLTNTLVMATGTARRSIWHVAATATLIGACAQAQGGVHPPKIEQPLAFLVNDWAIERQRGDSGSPAEGYATRAALAAVASPAHLDDAYLAEAGREGRFIFNGVDLSAPVAIDTQQGVYIAPATAPTGSSGAWVRAYSGAVNIKWFGAKEDDLTDDTGAIEGALSMAGAIFVPPGTYRHAPTAATGFLSNTTIFGAGNGSVIKYAPLSPPVWTDIQQVLRPRAYANVHNIVIRDLVIDGNRDGVDWSAMTGDGGAFGLALWGTQNVFLDNIEVRNAYTDAYYFAYTHSSIASRRNCENIRFGTLYAYNSGRQGMSIISCEGMYGNRLHVDTVNRVAPRAALDLEPNNTSPDLIKNIHIAQVTGQDVGSGVLFAGVSPIEDVTIGSIDLKNVTHTFGLQIKKAKNVQIGSARIEMGNGDWYSLYATDFENVHIGSFDATQTAGVITGTNGGVLIDTLPASPTYSNLDLRIDHFHLNGARGNGFRHNAGTISLGFAKAENVNQANIGGLGFFLNATARIEYISTDSSGEYGIRLGSNTNVINSGDVVTGVTGAINRSGFRADFGSVKVDGQGYQINSTAGRERPRR